MIVFNRVLASFIVVENSWLPMVTPAVNAKLQMGYKTPCLENKLEPYFNSVEIVPVVEDSSDYYAI